jgi:outer membrane protein assembly factor BamB
VRTGKVSTWYDAARLAGGFKPDLTLPAAADLRYSLTVAEGCVFARLGSQYVRDVRPPERNPRDRDTGESLLVCLSLQPGRGDRRRWLVKAVDLARKDYSVFEGAPVAGNGRVYIAATRFEGGKVITAIHCYPIDPEDSEPTLLWRADVCATRELVPARPDGTVLAAGRRARHHLLTLAGSQVVYCSHSGAVVALDARTGRRSWSLRYPRRDLRAPADDPTLRDLAPPLFAGGRLYVAPTDSDSLMCLEPASGRTVWERRKLHAVHLLGVGQGRLIFSTRRNPGTGRLDAGGLRAVRAEDGSDKGGWLLPDDGGGLTPMGRGLLVGDLVLWPTARKPYGVFAVRQRDGRQPDNPSLLHRMPAGNLLLAGGCLVVTGTRSMSVFVPPGLLLDEAEKEARAAPASPAAHLRLARALADRGDSQRALESFRRAERLAAGAGHTNKSVARAVQRERPAVLLEQARAAAGARRWKEAEEAARQARTGGTPRVRLRALLDAAALWQQAEQPARAADGWRAVLADSKLCSLQVEDGAGILRTAGAATAAMLPEDGRRTTQRGELLRTARDREKARRPGAAAWAYRRALAAPGKGAERAPLLIGLARAYEAQRCWQAARAAWERLAREHGTLELTELDPKRPVRDFVAAHVRKPSFSPPAPAALTLPLLRQVCIDLAPRERLLPPAPFTGDPTPDRLFSARGGALRCRAAESGKLLWTANLPFVPEWVGLHLDLVVAAGSAGVAGLSRDEGKVWWSFPAPVLARYPASRARAGEDTPWLPPLHVVIDPLPAEPLGGFRLAAGRVFCMQGGRRLFALDAESGDVLWQRWAPGAEFRMPFPRGHFGPHYLADAATVLLQASGRLWLLDAATGRVRHEERTALKPWPRPPLPVDDKGVCLVPGQRRVILLEPATGKTRWTYTPRGASTRSGEPPLVVAGPEAVLVVVPANIGYWLQRLDPTTGERQWKRRPLFQLARLDPAGWAVDGGAVYHTEAGKELVARSLADGKVLWRRAFPAGLAAPVVRLARGGDYLLAWPLQGDRLRFRFRWLFGSLQWEKAVAPPAGGPAPVLCFDAKTGRLVQRVNCEVGPARGSLRFGAGAPRIWPGLSAERRPAAGPSAEVWLDGSGLIVGREGRVWRLGPAKR